MTLFVNEIPYMIRIRAHFLVLMTHRQRVRQDMWPPRPVYERYPQLWFLLGLLFIATGLHLGFEFSMSFLYMMVGFFCCAFGIVLFLLRLFERPIAQTAGEPRKPIEFASGEPGYAEPVQAMPGDNPAPVMEKPETQ